MNQMEIEEIHSDIFDIYQFISLQIPLCLMYIISFWHGKPTTIERMNGEHVIESEILAKTSTATLYIFFEIKSEKWRRKKF